MSTQEVKRKPTKEIRIVRHKDDKVVHSIDVSGRSDRSIEKVERGANVNLNHEEYYTEVWREGDDA